MRSHWACAGFLCRMCRWFSFTVENWFFFLSLSLFASFFLFLILHLFSNQSQSGDRIRLELKFSFRISILFENSVWLVGLNVPSRPSSRGKEEGRRKKEEMGEGRKRCIPAPRSISLYSLFLRMVMLMLRGERRERVNPKWEKGLKYSPFFPFC